MRAWLLLSAFDVPFDEVRVALYEENFRAEIAKHTKAGKVPVLHDENLIVWDSLAICEYISEQYLNGGGWPPSPQDRAMARSCCAEMHSGFFTLRAEMPMNCRADNRKIVISENLQKDISRIDTLWSETRRQYANKGPWLCSQFSIVDCMFAPVVFRFHTYDVIVSESSKQYMNNVLSHPKVQLWLQQARAENETIESEEVGL